MRGRTKETSERLDVVDSIVKEQTKSQLTSNFA